MNRLIWKRFVAIILLIIFCTTNLDSYAFTIGGNGSSKNSPAGSSSTGGSKLAYGFRISITRPNLDTGIIADDSNEIRKEKLRKIYSENYLTATNLSLYYQGYDESNRNMTGKIIFGTKKTGENKPAYFTHGSFKHVAYSNKNPFCSPLKKTDLYDNINNDNWTKYYKEGKKSVTKDQSIAAINKLLSSGTKVNESLSKFIDEQDRKKNPTDAETEEYDKAEYIGYVGALFTLYQASGENAKYKDYITSFFKERFEDKSAKTPTLICVEVVMCVTDMVNDFWVTVPQAFAIAFGCDIKEFTHYSENVGKKSGNATNGDVFTMIENIHKANKKTTKCCKYGTDVFWKILTKRFYSKYFNCSTSSFSTYSGDYQGKYAMTTLFTRNMYGFCLAGSHVNNVVPPPTSVFTWELDPSGKTIPADENKNMDENGKMENVPLKVVNINVTQKKSNSKNYAKWEKTIKANLKKKKYIKFEIIRWDDTKSKNNYYKITGTKNKNTTYEKQGKNAPAKTTNISKSDAGLIYSKTKEEFTVNKKVEVSNELLLKILKEGTFSYTDYITATLPNKETFIKLSYAVKFTVYFDDEAIPFTNKTPQYIKYQGPPKKGIIGPPDDDENDDEEEPEEPEEYFYESSVAVPYSELKCGFLNDGGSYEPYEAMAGTPTTENLYYATGGTEFLVQIRYEYVKEGSGKRNYTQPTLTRRCSTYIPPEERPGAQDSPDPGAKPAPLTKTCGKCGDVITVDWKEEKVKTTRWNWAATASVPSHVTSPATETSPAQTCGGGSGSSDKSDSPTPGDPAIATCPCGTTVTVPQKKTGETRWDWKWVNPGHDENVSHTISWTQNITEFNYAKITDCKVWQLTKAELDGTYDLLDTEKVTATIANNPTSYLYNITDVNDASSGRFWHSEQPNNQDTYKFSTYDPEGTCSECVTYFAGETLSKKNPEKIFNNTYVISDYLILRTSAGDLSLMYFEYDSKNKTVPVGTIQLNGPAKNGSYEVKAEDVSFKDQNDKAKESDICKAKTTYRGIELGENAITYGGYNGRFASPSTKYKSTKDFTQNITITDLRINETTYSKYKKSDKPSETFKLVKNQVDIPDMTKINGEYIVGESNVFYENVINYGTVDEPIEAIEPVERFGANGFELPASYSPTHEKINDIVIHNPTSSQYALLIPLNSERDQRSSSEIKTEQPKDIDETCSGDASTCSYSHLHCSWGGTTYHTDDCYLIGEETYYKAIPFTDHVHTSKCAYIEKPVQYAWTHGSGCSFAGVTHYSTSNTVCSVCTHTCGGNIVPMGGKEYKCNNLPLNTYSDGTTKIRSTEHKLTNRTLVCDEVHHSMSTNWRRYTEGFKHSNGNYCQGIGCVDCNNNVTLRSPGNSFDYIPNKMSSEYYLISHDGQYHLTHGADNKCDHCNKQVVFDTYFDGTTEKPAVFRVTDTDAPSINTKANTSSNYHYSFGDNVCWEACKNNANHVVTPSVNVGGTTYNTTGDFVNLDYGFQIYFPNNGNFYGNGALGIDSTTDYAGKGYTSPMDTTTWIKDKYVVFGFDVIYDKNGNGEFSNDELYIAGEPIKLGTFSYKGNNSKNNWNDDSNNNLYNFYVPLESEEAFSSDVEFYTVALNSEDEFWYENEMPHNYTKEEKRAKHDSYKHIRVDLVGRIGALTMIDTGDFRFANLFKEVIPGEWLIDNIVNKVNSKKQNYFMADPYTIRGEIASEKTNGLNTYGTQPDKAQINKRVNFPLLPLSNNIDSLKKQPQRIGYLNYMSLDTIGNYYGENVNTDYFKIQITPYYYHLDLTTGVWTPVDVYMKMNNSYKKINKFNNSESTTDYEWIYSLNWTEENARRNYKSVEKTSTDLVVDNYISVKAVGDEQVLEKILIPSGREYAFGTAQRLYLKDKNRTFIGSSLTEGGTTNPGKKLDEAVYARQAQHWNFTLGLPSSSVFIKTGDPCTQANIEKLANNHSVIVCALEVLARGEVWTLKYDGTTAANQKIKVLDNGNTYDYKNNPNAPGDKIIVNVYSPDKSARQDLKSEGTH